MFGPLSRSNGSFAVFPHLFLRCHCLLCPRAWKKKGPDIPLEHAIALASASTIIESSLAFRKLFTSCVTNISSPDHRVLSLFAVHNLAPEFLLATLERFGIFFLTEKKECRSFPVLFHQDDRCRWAGRCFSAESDSMVSYFLFSFYFPWTGEYPHTCLVSYVAGSSCLCFVFVSMTWDDQYFIHHSLRYALLSTFSSALQNTPYILADRVAS